MFPDRWNPGNDGTDYEPCTSLSPEAARMLDIDRRSAADVAIVNGQTARGCSWRYQDDVNWNVSQMVGNSPSLVEYKQSLPGGWRDDISLAGKLVAVGSMSIGDCSTHVASQRAIVTTLVQYISTVHPPVDEICARAIAFTQATIDKMPR